MKYCVEIIVFGLGPHPNAGEEPLQPLAALWDHGSL